MISIAQVERSSRWLFRLHLVLSITMVLVHSFALMTLLKRLLPRARLDQFAFSRAVTVKIDLAGVTLPSPLAGPSRCRCGLQKSLSSSSVATCSSTCSSTCSTCSSKCSTAGSTSTASSSSSTVTSSTSTVEQAPLSGGASVIRFPVQGSWEVLPNHALKVIGVLGFQQSGKSFVLRELSDLPMPSRQAEEKPSVSLIFHPVQFLQENFVCVEGSGLLEANKEIPVNIREKPASQLAVISRLSSELLVEDIIFRLSNVVVIVVNKISAPEQCYLTAMLKRLVSVKVPRRCAIMIHNFSRVSDPKELDALWRSQVTGVYAGVEKPIGQGCSMLTSWDPVNDLVTYHLALAMKDTEAGELWNSATLAQLQHLCNLLSVPLQAQDPFDPLERFETAAATALPKYVNVQGRFRVTQDRSAFVLKTNQQPTFTTSGVGISPLGLSLTTTTTTATGPSQGQVSKKILGLHIEHREVVAPLSQEYLEESALRIPENYDDGGAVADARDTDQEEEDEKKKSDPECETEFEPEIEPELEQEQEPEPEPEPESNRESDPEPEPTDSLEGDPEVVSIGSVESVE